jgi:hypothetical protein
MTVSLPPAVAAAQERECEREAKPAIGGLHAVIVVSQKSGGKSGTIFRWCPGVSTGLFVARFS